MFFFSLAIPAAITVDSIFGTAELLAAPAAGVEVSAAFDADDVVAELDEAVVDSYYKSQLFSSSDPAQGLVSQNVDALTCFGFSVAAGAVVGDGSIFSAICAGTDAVLPVCGNACGSGILSSSLLLTTGVDIADAITGGIFAALVALVVVTEATVVDAVSFGTGLDAQITNNVPNTIICDDFILEKMKKYLEFFELSVDGIEPSQ